MKVRNGAVLAPPPISNGTILRRILALAGPTGVVSVLQVTAQLIDTWLAAQHGTLALAGWAVVLPFTLLLQQMSSGAMGGGVSSAIARALGAGKTEEASALVLHAILIAITIGGIFAIVLAGFPRTVLGAIGGPQAAEAAASYAMWMFGLGAIPAWLTNTLASVLRGGGRHALAARVLLVNWLTVPALAWYFSLHLGMGLVGLGVAYGISFWASTLMMATLVLGGGAGFVPTFRVRPSWILFYRILRVGLVACCLAAIANLTTILVTAQLKVHGPAAVAAYGISARLEFLMIPVAFGVGSALTALVGKAVGAGDWATARRTAWAGGALAFAVTSTMGALVGLFPSTFASAFTQDPSVLAVATRALGFIGPAFGGFGLGMALYFASMGAGRMRGPCLGALSRIGLAVGGGWVLANVLGMGIDGQFLGVAFGLTAYGLITASFVRRGVWGS